jgi:hypothetical protein
MSGDFAQHVDNISETQSAKELWNSLMLEIRSDLWGGLGIAMDLESQVGEVS